MEEDLNDIHVSAQEEDGQDILSEMFDKSEFYEDLRVFYELLESRRLSNSLSSLQSAFLVSDVTADPERAARSLANDFENVAYHDVTEVNFEFLREQHGFDLLLMSVHGHINNTSEDHVGLGDGSALSEDFSSIMPKLAYFDSCRLGISNSFIDTFSRVGSLYFIAPILSNEAGNSSTKTIELFFSHLEEGQRPEVALFNTRKELWNIYGDESFAYRVWRAFPFRIYRLN